MDVGMDRALTMRGEFARELPELAVAWQAQSFPHATLLVLGEELAAELGLDSAWLRSPAGLGFLTGNIVAEGATAVAQAYAGHQFGGYSPRLGDGRALLLGEVQGTGGRLRDIHLKGSGPTPFSRGGDGFAAMGPMLREYVVSEAMHGLGIATTRMLAVVATGRPVRREAVLPGALLTRVASSHLRVGSFQYAAASGDTGLLRRLTLYAIERHYPEQRGAENPALALFDAVVGAQASLVAEWMLVGFVHGVMNTDNMNISGETIDYGPCAFIDAFDPSAVFSSIDLDGRYAFGNQPTIAEWNLARFAEALLPLIDDDPERAVELARGSLGAFRGQYAAAWSAGMRAKLGLDSSVDEGAIALIDDLMDLMQASRVDYTSFFRRLGGVARGVAREVAGMDDVLGDVLAGAAPDRAAADRAAADRAAADRGAADHAEVDHAEADHAAADRGAAEYAAAFAAWAARWLAMAPDAVTMDAVNPAYIPRNHLVEEALAAALDGDLGPFDELVSVVRDPYTVRPGFERYAQPAPDSFGDYQTFCGT